MQLVSAQRILLTHVNTMILLGLLRITVQTKLLERERERETETETETERQRQRQTDRQTDRQRQRERETGTERDRETDRERDRERLRETETETERSSNLAIQLLNLGAVVSFVGSDQRRYTVSQVHIPCYRQMLDDDDDDGIVTADVAKMKMIKTEECIAVRVVST